MPLSLHHTKGIALVLALVFLQGCTSLLHEEVNYHGEHGNRQFDQRVELAKPTKLTREQLMDQGYVYVGRANVTYTVQQCEGSGKNNCKPIEHTDNATHRLLKKAAERGGELVQLDKDNLMKNATKNVRTKCAVYGDGTHQEYRYIYKPNAYGNSLDYVYEKVTVRDCMIWDSVSHGIVEQVSSGKIWRKDPELVKIVRLESALSSGTYKEVSHYLKVTDGYKQLMYKARHYPLYYAVKSDNAAAIRALVDNGMPVKSPVVYSTDVVTGEIIKDYPLIQAVENRSVNSVKYLLEHGADPNTPPALPVSIIHYRSSKNEKKKVYQVIKLLMKHGADPSKAGTEHWFRGMNAYDAAYDRHNRRGFMNKKDYDKILSLIKK